MEVAGAFRYDVQRDSSCKVARGNSTSSEDVTIWFIVWKLFQGSKEISRTTDRVHGQVIANINQFTAIEQVGGQR